MPELWNESGDVYVHLFPKSSGFGPSFKVASTTINTSILFNELLETDQYSQQVGQARSDSFGGRHNLMAEDAERFARQSPPETPRPYSPEEAHLYVPIPTPQSGGEAHDVDRLVGIRNLFAFLVGQPLVATQKCPEPNAVFIQLAGILAEFGFSSMDGASFGDAVDAAFGSYVEQFGLADLRFSRKKTIEALILAEKMRSHDLYNNAFPHAVGRYQDLMDLKSPLLQHVSVNTRQKLERAHFELSQRQQSVNQRLETFDFPSLFAGIAASTTMTEIRNVRFKLWRVSFNRMKSFVFNYYKHAFGNWPPRASSKKNPFSESGLNRLVLKVLYSDMCALYDLLVDRSEVSPRMQGEDAPLSFETEPQFSAIRRICSEFDRSSPPVLPSVPFDTPLLPTMSSILETYSDLPPKEQVKFDRKIKEHELKLILNKAYNYDVSSLKLQFLDAFKDFELREVKGKLAQDMVDQRIGYWLFLYVTIQSLPMLVVDAPGIKHTDAVEYFLCQPPRGSPPWIESGSMVRKMWYEVAGGSGIVEMSEDAVLFSVEATYHRSHCWLAAKEWEGINAPEMPIAQEYVMSPLDPPAHFFQNPEFSPHSSPQIRPTSQRGSIPAMPSPPLSAPRYRNASPVSLSPPNANRSASTHRSSIAFGIEPIPVPDAFHNSHQRSSSAGPRPVRGSVHRIRSVVNVNMDADDDFRASPPPRRMTDRMGRAESPARAAQGGQTFDDILASVPKQEKKKSRFFL